MVKALNVKKEDMKRPRDSKTQLYPIKWEGTINRTQFLARASKSKTSVLLAFTKDTTRKGIAGETKLWREMNFVTSAELYH